MQDNNIIRDAIDCIKLLKYEIKELKIENEKLRALCDTYRTCYQAKHGDIKCLFVKYKQTLQEIKAIAKTGMHCEGMGCDFMPKILDLITKAEEE